MTARVSAYLRAVLVESDVALSSTARHLVEVLGHYASASSATAWPSMTTLAARMGKSRRVIRRARAELVAAGVIAFEERRGHPGDTGSTNRYRFPVATPLGLSTEGTWATGVDDVRGDVGDRQSGRGRPVEDPLKSDVLTNTYVSNRGPVDNEDDAVPDRVLTRFPALARRIGAGP